MQCSSIIMSTKRHILFNIFMTLSPTVARAVFSLRNRVFFFIFFMFFFILFFIFFSPSSFLLLFVFLYLLVFSFLFLLFFFFLFSSYSSFLLFPLFFSPSFPLLYLLLFLLLIFSSSSRAVFCATDLFYFNLNGLSRHPQWGFLCSQPAAKALLGRRS